MEDLFIRYWQQMLALVLLIVWSVRQESRIGNVSRDLTKEIKRLDDLRSDDLRDAAEARASTNAKLDRLDDKIERNFAEFRSDIKTLIRQGAEK
ncbi:hypothetical protein [Rhizobium wenxiniae]|uniref:hypothetical protein n=1 Tax=Rhizobium wenxiniae TaxID=1737357 RepID=UPI003C184605